jgi:hypothetical protein
MSRPEVTVAGEIVVSICVTRSADVIGFERLIE